MRAISSCVWVAGWRSPHFRFVHVSPFKNTPQLSDVAHYNRPGEQPTRGHLFCACRQFNIFDCNNIIELLDNGVSWRDHRPREITAVSGFYVHHGDVKMAERAVLSADAGVYVWDGATWQSQGGEISHIDVYYHPFAQTYRVVAGSSKHGFVMNCYLHAEAGRKCPIKKPTPTPYSQAHYEQQSEYFHTWKGYDGVSYGLSFRRDAEAPYPQTYDAPPTRLTLLDLVAQAAAFAMEVEALIREMDGAGDEDWIPPEASPQRNATASPLFGTSPTPPRRPRDKSLLDRTSYIGRRATPPRGAPSILLSPALRDGAQDSMRKPSSEPRGWEAATNHGEKRLMQRPPAPPKAPTTEGQEGKDPRKLLPPLSPTRAWAAAGAWGGDGALVGEGRDEATKPTTDKPES